MSMLPEWLSITPATTERYAEIKNKMSSRGMHTVCTEAHCPNTSECWSKGTATFLVLGEVCTRGCRFCSTVKGAKGREVDADEPKKLAAIVGELGLRYVVVTSVCRDDLPDQGAGHFASCISEIKRTCPDVLVEVLIPDFGADAGLLGKIVDAHPDVIGHNIETVERLSSSTRDGRASYLRSLKVLEISKTLDSKIYTKSAIMLGMGEDEKDIISSFKDLRGVGTDFLAIGQYLRPTPKQMEVKEYVRPEKFDDLKRKAISYGFLHVASGPFVRSSYDASAYFLKK
jgi:lipoyl synthase